MKKIVSSLLISLGILITVISTCTDSISTSTKTYMGANAQDTTPPVCQLSIKNSIKRKEIVTGMITCTDANGLKDTKITTSDIISNRFLLDKVKILNVSDPYTYDGKTYKWYFEYKGQFWGKTSIYLINGAVTDLTGNQNRISKTEVIKIAF